MPRRMIEEIDSALVRRCLEGDRRSFDRLMDRYESPIYNAVLRMVGDPEDARDTTQSAFVKALSNLDRFDPSYRFFSWLYRIAMNESLNLLDRRSRREIPTETATAGERIAGRDGLAATEAGIDLQEALARVAPDRRQVIVLKHILGCSYRDIAAILDLPEKTVKSRLFTAREELRRELTGGSAIDER